MVKKIIYSPVLTSIYYFSILLFTLLFLNIPNFFPTNTDNIISLKPDIIITSAFIFLTSINAVIVFFGVRSKKFAFVVCKYIDPFLLLITLVGFGYAYLTPCEDLGCGIINGIIAVFSLLILVSFLLHAPVLYQAQSKMKSDFVSRMPLFFMIGFLLIQLVLHFSLIQMYKSKFQELDVSIYKPTYLPAEIENKSQEWYSNDNYGINYSGYNFIFITGKIPSTNAGKKLLQTGGKEIPIRNTRGIVLTKDDEVNPFYINSTIIWIEDGTEIQVSYSEMKQSTYKNATLESVQQEALKIAESMQLVN